MLARGVKHLVLRCASMQVECKISDDVCLWRISANKARFYVGLGRGVDTTAKAVEATVCEIMRMPGTRAGLNERSQSAYAMPSPTPVDNDTVMCGLRYKRMLTHTRTKMTGQANFRRVRPRGLRRRRSLDRCTITSEQIADSSI